MEVVPPGPLLPQCFVGLTKNATLRSPVWCAPASVNVPNRKCLRCAVLVAHIAEVPALCFDAAAERTGGTSVRTFWEQPLHGLWSKVGPDGILTVPLASLQAAGNEAPHTFILAIATDGCVHLYEARSEVFDRISSECAFRTLHSLESASRYLGVARSPRAEEAKAGMYRASRSRYSVCPQAPPPPQPQPVRPRCWAIPPHTRTRDCQRARWAAGALLPVLSVHTLCRVQNVAEHLTEHHRVTCVHAGERVRIEDFNAVFVSFETLAVRWRHNVRALLCSSTMRTQDAFAYLDALLSRPASATLQKFDFLPRWHTLSPDERLAKVCV